MYIWTGLVFNKNDEEKIREICKEVNYNYNVNEFDIEEHKILRKFHNMLNEKLLEKYEIPLIKFDGNNFQFHSTIF